MIDMAAMLLDDDNEHLANTWKWFPAEPFTVAGYPVTCPGCGAADGIRYWLHPRATMVRAEHTCVPCKGPRHRSTVRRWDEYRMSPEIIRDRGITMLASVEADLRANPFP